MLRIAHRGASALAPENTLAAFRLALEQGCDGIELDIHRTRDGHLVVIHDHALGRTAAGRGLIRDLPLAVVKQADAGAWKGPRFAGERVPTLDETLALLLPAGILVFIELKAGSFHYPGIEADLLALLQRHDAVERVQVSSFDHWALKRLRELAPRLPLGMLYEGNPLDPIGMARAIGATAIHPGWHFVSPDLVTAAHAAGLHVNVWTVNDPAVARQLQAAGVDGIMSDSLETFQGLG